MINLKKISPILIASCFYLNTSFAAEQCYWMSNTATGNPWVLAPQGNVDKKTCFNLDSCNGGLAQSGGGCYKWATAPNADRIEWGAVDVAQCYWMSNTAGNPWVAAPQGKISKKECFNLDSCNGGLAQSGGGCYKWATTANADRIVWDNVSTNNIQAAPKAPATIAPTPVVNAKGPAVIAAPAAIAPAPVVTAKPAAVAAPAATAPAPVVTAKPSVIAAPTTTAPAPVVVNAKGPAVISAPVAQANIAPTTQIMPLGGTIYRGNNLVYTNNMLSKGMFICSPSKEFAAVYQEDGNFCVYQAPAKPNEAKRFIWCTQNKVNFEAGKNGAIVLQGDGNLGHYTKCDVSARCDGWLWDALRGKGINVQGQSYRLSMQDDGNLVIYNNSDNKFIWGSMATAPSNKGKFSECK